MNTKNYIEAINIYESLTGQIYDIIKELRKNVINLIPKIDKNTKLGCCCDNDAPYLKKYPKWAQDYIYHNKCEGLCDNRKLGIKLGFNCSSCKELLNNSVMFEFEKSKVEDGKFIVKDDSTFVTNEDAPLTEDLIITKIQFKGKFVRVYFSILTELYDKEGNTYSALVKECVGIPYEYLENKSLIDKKYKEALEEIKKLKPWDKL